MRWRRSSPVRRVAGRRRRCCTGTSSRPIAAPLARTTFGTGRNDQDATILGFYNSPTPAWLEASDWCAAHVIRLRVNPAQGLATQQLNLLPPPIASQDTPGERNTLLFDGISTFTVSAAGVCRIDRSITTYQSNASGQPDNSYLNT